jgi:hypothetical protein
MTIDETRQLFELLSGMYPTLKVEKNTIKGYHLMLADVPLPVMLAALPAVLSEHPTFCPTAPQLRNAVMASAVDALPTAAEAWEQVEAEIRRVGSWGRPRFSDPLVARAVTAIGWQEICLTELEQMGTLRAQFRDLFQAFRGSAVRERATAGIGAGSDVLAIGNGVPT